jgi:hypothetical protein
MLIPSSVKIGNCWKITVEGKALVVLGIWENKKWKFYIMHYKNNKQMKSYAKSCMQATPPPPQIIIDNCSIQIFHMKWHQFQVKNVLFVTPAKAVCVKKLSNSSTSSMGFSKLSTGSRSHSLPLFPPNCCCDCHDRHLICHRTTQLSWMPHMTSSLSTDTQNWTPYPLVICSSHGRHHACAVWWIMHKFYILQKL